MLDFLRSLFGRAPMPRRVNVVPEGVRDAVEFTWVEPIEEGSPPPEDLERLRGYLAETGWEPDVHEMGYAVELSGQRGDAMLTVGIGHNGEGPWVGFIGVIAEDDVPDAAQWIQQVHDTLVKCGATSLRWYERAAHSRGDVADPWSGPQTR